MLTLEKNERQIILNNLSSGNLNNINYSIRELYEDNDFEALKCLTHGINYNHNIDMLLMIYTLMLQNINTSKNKIILNCSLEVIKEVISVAENLRTESKTCIDILDECSKSRHMMLRLFAVCTVSYPEAFIYDKESRITDIAYLRSSLNTKLKTMHEQELKELNFLKSALITGVITLEDTKKEWFPNTTTVLIKSPLFIDGEEQMINSDIIFNVPDKIVLANELNSLIKEDKLTFKKGAKPLYFKDASEYYHLKK